MTGHAAVESLSSTVRRDESQLKKGPEIFHSSYINSNLQSPDTENSVRAMLQKTPPSFFKKKIINPFM